MSHYRALIEKLSVRHVERDDFEELYTLSNDALNELSGEEREEVERHATVVAATALSKAKGNAKGAIDTLKGLERQLVGVSFPELTMMRGGVAPAPMRAPLVPVKRTSIFSVILYVVIAFLALIFLVGMAARR